MVNKNFQNHTLHALSFEYNNVSYSTVVIFLRYLAYDSIYFPSIGTFPSSGPDIFVFAVTAAVVWSLPPLTDTRAISDMMSLRDVTQFPPSLFFVGMREAFNFEIV